MSIPQKTATWEILAKLKNGHLSGLEAACSKLNCSIFADQEHTNWTEESAFFPSGGLLHSYMVTHKVDAYQSVIWELRVRSRRIPELVIRVDYYDEDGTCIRHHISEGECETMRGVVVYPEPKKIFW